MAKKAPDPIEGDSFKWEGLAEGNYRLEWWDTRNGKVVETKIIAVAGPSLTITIPAFAQDIAGKLLPQAAAR